MMLIHTKNELLRNTLYTKLTVTHTVSFKVTNRKENKFLKTIVTGDTLISELTFVFKCLNNGYFLSSFTLSICVCLSERFYLIETSY